MRRRTAAEGDGDWSRVPVELREPPWDLSVPVPRGWTGYDDWVAARQEWIDAGNTWPTGEEGRVREEDDAHFPDEIWDPDFL